MGKDRLSVQSAKVNLRRKRKTNAHVITKKNPNAKMSSGLGLYIVKKIVEAHQGRIWIEDNADQGSIFIFKIPTA